MWAKNRGLATTLHTATAAEDAEDAIDNPSARETASMFLRDFPTEVVKNLKPASREN